MVIMKYKKFLSIMNDSVKDISLNRILDKVLKKVSITDGEKRFLDNFDKVEDRDYIMVSKESVIKIIYNLIESGRVVVCNLNDRDGLIGLEIESIDNDFQDDSCVVHLKGSGVFKLEDRFLYNIIYNIDRSEYSLEVNSEYYEKIPVVND